MLSDWCRPDWAPLLAPLTYHVSRRLFPDLKSELRLRYLSLDRGLLPAAHHLPDRPRNRKPFLFACSSCFLLLLKIPDSQFPTPNSHSSILYSLLSGFFLALAALTRSVILPFAGLAVLWVWFILKQKRRRLSYGVDDVDPYRALDRPQLAPAPKTDRDRILDGLQPVPRLPPGRQWLLYIWPIPRFALHS